MLKHTAPYRAELVPTLPALCRPLVRYREEEFGWLAAFPEGRVGMYAPAAGPLLAAGAPYEECVPHLLPTLRIGTDFRFSAPLIAWVEITRRCNLRCPHCFVNAGPARAGEMTTQRILALLDEWAEMGVFTVV
ncbi:MAG TPA: hypothetical protein VFT45_14100, partial [Longimicrobium sp.]|nr:hypothetical protein [Longimicrobium sp.]